MNRWPLVFWAVVFLVLTVLFGARLAMREQRPPLTRAVPRGEAPPPGHKVQHFTLTERSGRSFNTESLRGQVWVASFFFTSCPGACLKLNNSISAMQSDLLADGATLVSITVDPERDTLPELVKYADHYHADADRWLFLTGTMSDIQRAAEQGFQVSVARVTHSDRLIVVDRHGVVRGTYRGTDDNQVSLLKRKVRELSEERS